MELVFLVILVLLMASALGSGFPVAFALPGSAIMTIVLAGVSGAIFAGDSAAYFHTGNPWQWMSAGVTNLRSVYWVAERDTLIAVPLFIFMGIMLQKSKIAEDLLVTMAQLFGPVPGGLGISVVFVGALLAATTGIVGATVVAMGLISLPAMMRNKYSTPLATGTIAASGTLGQIIPPSIVLIILADQLATATDQAGVLRTALYKTATGEFSMPSIFDVGSTSAGEMFLGALVPGLVLVALYMIYILIFALLRPSSAPAVDYGGKFDLKFWRKVGLTLVPPLALIFLVLGSIVAGVATVNQAGAIGASGALVMAGYRLPESSARRYWPAIIAISATVVLAYTVKNYPMNIKLIRSTHDLVGIWIGVAASVALLGTLIWSGLRVYRIDDTLNGVMLETAKTTSLVFVILLGAAILTASFRAFGGEDLVRSFLNGLPGGFWSKFVVVMGVIFILGFFLDFIEISVVVVPIVAPILLADPSANITAVWLGVMIGLNIQTSFLTPPFGFALFYLRGVAPPSVKTTEIYKGVIAFIGLQLIALVIVGLTPSLVNYLPNRVSYLSETSPPPRNPKLQQCLRTFVSDRLATDDGATLAAISAVKGLDLTVLPKKVAGGLSKGFSDAEAAIESLNGTFVAEKAVEEASITYRPIWGNVRQLEKQIRRGENRIKKINEVVGQSQRTTEKQRARLEAEKAVLESDAQKLKDQIPPEWSAEYAAFSALTKEEQSKQLAYQRQADNSWSSVFSFLGILDANAQFAAEKENLHAMRDIIANGDPAETQCQLNDVAKRIGGIAGASKIKSTLLKARRSLKTKKPDVQKALKMFDKAAAAYDEQLVWRAAAEKTLRPTLASYLDAIKGTIGARMQPKMTREQALFIASCNAGHEDISLNF